MDASLRTGWHCCTSSCNHHPAQTTPLPDTRAAQPGRELEGSPLAADFGADRLGKPDPKRRVLLRGGTIISMDDKVGDFAVGDILIEGSRIAAVGASIEAHD